MTSIDDLLPSRFKELYSNHIALIWKKHHISIVVTPYNCSFTFHGMTLIKRYPNTYYYIIIVIKHSKYNPQYMKKHTKL